MSLHRYIITLAFITSLFASVCAADAPPKDADFPGGIGFYIRQDGKLFPLVGEVSIRDVPMTENVILFKTSDSIFTYGLNFSAPTMVGPMPPHLVGYKWGVIRPDGTIQGDWPLRFKPVNGLMQPTYEIYFDGPAGDLVSGKLSHKCFYIKLPEGHAYVLRLTDVPNAGAK